ncbi:MAG: hypothetical protein AAFQ71_12585 [Planctomycetota bacterium]
MPNRATTRVALAAAAIALLAGCSFRDGDARVYPVFGIGFVRVAEPLATQDPQAESLTVRKTQAVGVLIGPNPAVGGLMVGATKRQEVIVPTDAEVLVNATSFTDGGFKVKVDNIRPDGSSIEPQDRARPADPAAGQDPPGGDGGDL